MTTGISMNRSPSLPSRGVASWPGATPQKDEASTQSSVGRKRVGRMVSSFVARRHGGQSRAAGVGTDRIDWSTMTCPPSSYARSPLGVVKIRCCRLVWDECLIAKQSVSFRGGGTERAALAFV